MGLKNIYKLLMFLFALFLLSAGIPWIVNKLDTRTPEQKEKAKQEYSMKERKRLMEEYEALKREYPSMKLDGKVVPVEVQWVHEGATVVFPKTYGFGATRFAQKSIFISKSDFQGAEKTDSHYFIGKSVKIMSGPSESSCLYPFAIPKKTVPKWFLEAVK